MHYRQYVTIQFIAVVAFTFGVSLFFFQLDLIDKATALIIIFITIINCSALLEQRTWMYYLEHIRLLTICAYISYWLEQPEWLWLAAILAVASLWPEGLVKRWYLKTLYGEV
jgi:hypothetical protein